MRVPDDWSRRAVPGAATDPAPGLACNGETFIGNRLFHGETELFAACNRPFAGCGWEFVIPDSGFVMAEQQNDADEIRKRHLEHSREKAGGVIEDPYLRGRHEREMEIGVDWAQALHEPDSLVPDDFDVTPDNVAKLIAGLQGRLRDVGRVVGAAWLRQESMVRVDLVQQALFGEVES